MVIAHNIRMQVGDKIARARRLHDPALGQKELAEILEVSTSTVGRWESTHEVPESRVSTIARLLGVAVAWFWDQQDTLPEFSNGNAQVIPADRATGVAETSLQRGDEVLLAVWRGVLAGDGECEFYESSSPEFLAIPSFLAANDPDRHILCIASGASMFPRVKHGERIVIRIDPNPSVNSLVVARRPDGANFIKTLRQDHRGRLSLVSINEEFTPITDLDGWVLRGYAVAILHAYEPGQANIEWDSGRFLRA